MGGFIIIIMVIHTKVWILDTWKINGEVGWEIVSQIDEDVNQNGLVEDITQQQKPPHTTPHTHTRSKPNHHP